MAEKEDLDQGIIRVSALLSRERERERENWVDAAHLKLDLAIHNLSGFFAHCCVGPGVDLISKQVESDKGFYCLFLSFLLGLIRLNDYYIVARLQSSLT